MATPPNPLFFLAILLVRHKDTNTLVHPDRLVITEHKHTRSSNKDTTYINTSTPPQTIRYKVLLVSSKISTAYKQCRSPTNNERDVRTPVTVALRGLQRLPVTVLQQRCKHVCDQNKKDAYFGNLLL